MALEKKLEAVLFYKGEAEKKTALAKILEVSLEQVDEAATKLSADLSTRGIQLLTIGDQLELITSPETSDVITKVRKEELVKDLGKAGSETLAIILYRGPVSRADIDYIRGVNCSFILRNLQIRGLVERIHKPGDNRTYLYQGTPELLKHLGITNIESLPNYKEMKDTLQSFEAQRFEEETNTHPLETNI